MNCYGTLSEEYQEKRRGRKEEKGELPYPDDRDRCSDPPFRKSF